MFLQSIRLVNFKNYKGADLSFSSEINCFLGKNGSGKTNLLDAIHFLSMTKSGLNTQDQSCIQHGETLFSVKGVFNLDSKQREVLCGYQTGKKKVLKLDQNPYKKASEHVGRFPLVLIAPNDTDVIRGASDIRRKFFDAIISQMDQVYLNNLLSYNHNLKQRNSLLKRFGEQQYVDKDLLEPYTNKLISLGKEIYNQRTSFINEYKPLLLKHYENLSGGNELVDISYDSHFHNDINRQLVASFQKDLILKRSNIGIHKDEFHFLMEEEPIKKYGSQGQQKSFLIALKLAHFDIIHSNSGKKPLLLLDDIFDKLDDERIEKLIQMVGSDAFGQIFITDARPERSKNILKDLNQEVHFYNIIPGNINKGVTLLPSPNV